MLMQRLLNALGAIAECSVLDRSNAAVVAAWLASGGCAAALLEAALRWVGGQTRPVTDDISSIKAFILDITSNLVHPEKCADILFRLAMQRSQEAATDAVTASRRGLAGQQPIERPWLVSELSRPHSSAHGPAVTASASHIQAPAVRSESIPMQLRMFSMVNSCCKVLAGPATESSAGDEPSWDHLAAAICMVSSLSSSVSQLVQR